MKNSKQSKTLTTISIACIAAGLLLATVDPQLSTAAENATDTKRKIVRPTSYGEVTSKLDRGGTVFAYLSTEKWLSGLSETAGKYRNAFTGMVPKKETTPLNLFFDAGMRFLQRSGLEEISGVGLSTVTVGEDTSRSKVYLHHYTDQGKGFVWSFFGDQPHELNGLDLIPADAVVANYSDTDLRLIWSTVTNELAAVGSPEIIQGLAMLPMQFQAIAQMELSQFLDSIGGEFGWALMLNDKVRMPLPIPAKEAIDIPSPELMIVAKLNDRAIFDRIASMLGAQPNVTKVEENGATQIRMPAPIPFVPALQPVVAFDGEHLILTSHPQVLDKVLATKSGSQPGLRSNPEFARLAKYLPTQGNAFTFVSERFGQEAIQLQKKVNPLMAGAKNNDDVSKMFDLFNTATTTATVFANTEEGWMWTSIGNRSVGELMATSMVAVPGMIAAIAIPNFVKGRSTAQKNSCIANLKQIDGATQQWALEKKKTAKAKPELAPILNYLRGRKLPSCPGGGTYTLGQTVVRAPTCSVKDHTLSPQTVAVMDPPPSSDRSSNPRQSKHVCIRHLKQIDGATQQWALENKKLATDRPVGSEILKFLRREQLPVCPEGGKYDFGKNVSKAPTCTVPGHTL